MKKLFALFCILIPNLAFAEKPNEYPNFPIPPEVSELVTWTNLCEDWIKIENQNLGEPQSDSQNLIDTTPALSWARQNCGYEELESRVIALQEKYKSDPIIRYSLDNLIGIYKD